MILLPSLYRHVGSEWAAVWWQSGFISHQVVTILDEPAAACDLCALLFHLLVVLLFFIQLGKVPVVFGVSIHAWADSGQSIL